MTSVNVGLTFHFMNTMFLIVLSAKKVGVPVALLLSICFTETGLRNVTRLNDGGSPTYGVCQVKRGAGLQAYKFTKLPELAVMATPRAGEALKDVRLNAMASAGYLKYQYHRYKDWKKAVTAYNRGSWSGEKSHYTGKVMKRVRGKLACLGKSHGSMVAKTAPKPLKTQLVDLKLPNLVELDYLMRSIQRIHYNRRIRL